MRSLIVISVLMLFLNAAAMAQLSWVRSPGNPVLSGGGSASWDEHLCQPSVLYNEDSSRYEMWYTGSHAVFNSFAIGFAWSYDGINWTKYPGNPVLSPTPGSWDNNDVDGASVIRENGIYKMWYTGWTNTSNASGYATSPDGINWTKYSGNPVLIQPLDQWDKFTHAVSVHKYNNQYYMYYTGRPSYNSMNLQIGRAVSVDGINWTRNPGPVFKGGENDFDRSAYCARAVIENGFHYLFYTAFNSYNEKTEFGMAFSTDNGNLWTRNSKPVMSPESPGSWDDLHIETPNVLLMPDNTLKMWYSGNTTPELWRLGYAESVFNPVYLTESRLLPGNYIYPGESVTVNAKFFNSRNYAVSFRSIVENSGSDTVFTVLLFDDGLHSDSLAGDGIWGNNIGPVQQEDFYKAGFAIQNGALGITNNYSDQLRFTTAGPVLLDSISIVKRSFPVNTYDIKTFVKNHSSSAVITNAGIRILCNQPEISLITSCCNLPDIPPGATVSTSSPRFSCSSLPGSLSFNVELMSDGVTYWTDSYTIQLGSDDKAGEPRLFLLEQNYPNPFNPETEIKFSIPGQLMVTIEIFDILGNSAGVILNEEKQAGEYKLKWDASAFPSGVYFCRMHAGNFRKTNKMILLR